MFMSFSELANAYADEDVAPSWKSGQSFRAAWAVINDTTLKGEDREKAIVHWKNNVIQLLLEQREPITRVQKMNTRLYKGQHYFTQEQFSNLPYNRNRRYNPEKAKIVLNYIGQAVDQHVSDMSAFEPNLTVTPSNDEEQDRVSARMNKALVDHYFYNWELKTAFQTFHRRKKIQGEAFSFLLWDKDAGDLNPAYKEYRDMQLQAGQADTPMPLIDPETGAPILGDDNEPLFISRAVKVGDIVFEQEYSCRVLYPCPESYLWRDVPYVIRLMWMDVDEVKARWPQKAEKLRPDQFYKWGQGPASRGLTQKVLIRFMYHKPTVFLEKGYYCISSQNAFLEGGDYPFGHGELPCIRGTDIDLDFEITGMSFIQNLVSLNHAMNNSMSMVLQNQAHFAYPKYAAPRGAKVRYTDLGADRGIYEYSGPQKPELMVQNSTPQDTWRTHDAMRDAFKSLSAIYATSRGEGVDGITANVALRMIDEQERKLHKPAIDKHGQNVELLGSLILWTLAKLRDPTDGMLIKILGKNNERYLKYFDIAHLGKSYEVRLQRSSGLPENPAAKTQTVLDLSERFAGMWSHDEVLEYLDIPRPEKLIESATVSRQAAESEVEDLLSGVPNVTPPTPYHDILPRYRVYEKAVQSRAFDEADPVIKQRMLNHIATAEYIIMQKMKNPAFAQKLLMEHPNFPMVFPNQPVAQPFQLAQAPQPMMMGGDPSGAAPMGGIPPEMAAEGAMPPPMPSGPGMSESPMMAPQQQPMVPEPGALP